MSLALGLDIGTSSCKASIVNITKLGFYKVLATETRTYGCASDSDSVSTESGRFEISPSLIIESVHLCVKNLARDLREKVAYISVCGQMHGCLLWTGKPWIYDTESECFTIQEPFISNLVTWEDQRCDKDFLTSLPKSLSPLATGFGCATIFWLLSHEENLLRKYECTSTISDFLVAMLCDSDRPVMSYQNAYGFGFFDVKNHRWMEETLQNNGFPIGILPKVLPPGSIAGHCRSKWLEIPEKTPVYVALGDHQCSVYVCIQESSDKAALYIGTSMQLSVIVGLSESSEQQVLEKLNPAIRLVPYVGNNFLAVAASLNGGNVLQWFVLQTRRVIQQIARVEIEPDDIWRKLLEYTKSKHALPPIDKSTEETRFVVTLFGERHQPNSRASLLNISPELDIFQLFQLICRGLLDNMFSIMPLSWLVQRKVTEIIGSGRALVRNPFINNCLNTLSHQHRIKVSLKDECDAQIGAVLMVRKPTLIATPID